MTGARDPLPTFADQPDKIYCAEYCYIVRKHFQLLSIFIADFEEQVGLPSQRNSSFTPQAASIAVGRTQGNDSKTHTFLPCRGLTG